VERVIKEAGRAATIYLEDKLAAQKQIKAVKSPRNDKRRPRFET